MSDYSEREVYKGYRITLSHDDLGESPREECDNFGTMICWHNRYIIGDKHNYRGPEQFLQNFLEVNYEETLYAKLMRACERRGNQLGYNWEPTIKDMFPIFQQVALVLPIWAYEHGGITISTSNRGYPFCDRWDSGQLGWIYVTLDDVRKEFNRKRLSKKVIEKAYDILRQEAETYDQYLTGDVWFYEVDKWVGGTLDEDEYEDEEDYMDDDDCWEFVDNLGGLYGSDYALKEAQDVVDYHIAQQQKEGKCETL